MKLVRWAVLFIALVAVSVYTVDHESGSPVSLGASTPNELASFSTAAGYWLASSDGGVFTFGDASFHGSTGGLALNKPVVAMAPTPDGQGYWLVASDGGVFAFGDGSFHGSTGGLALNKPVVAMAPTPDGQGYWLVASDGGVFAFGDASFHGSTGGLALNKPVVAMAPTPDGQGYWLVASDGGVFAFGDASFHGSTGGLALNKPVVAMAPTPDGQGYWLVASDGGVFTFGDASFHGSTGGLALNKPVVAMAPTPDGQGYWLVASDGGVFTFGDASFHGSLGGLALNKPVVAMSGSAPISASTGVPSSNCVTGDAITGPYYDPNIWFSNGDGTTTGVKNQNTGANAGTTETLCNPLKSAENWTVAANMKGGTNVQYFPDMQEVLTTPNKNADGGQGQLVSGFNSLSSTFNTSDPGDGNGNWESAYDIWMDNRPGDIMIWEDTSTARGTGGAHVINSNVTIAGQSFTLMENCGSTCSPTTDEIMLVHNTNVTAGTENLLADLQYLQAGGYVPTVTGISEINFGFEICGTAGTTENFALNSYSLTKTP